MNKKREEKAPKVKNRDEILQGETVAISKQETKR